MPIWGWILVSVGGLIMLGIATILVAYALSPEAREARMVKQRMAANARRARQELYERTYKRTLQQLRDKRED